MKSEPWPLPHRESVNPLKTSPTCNLHHFCRNGSRQPRLLFLVLCNNQVRPGIITIKQTSGAKDGAPAPKNVLNLSREIINVLAAGQRQDGSRWWRAQKQRHITLLVFRQRELGSIKTIICLNACNEGN